MLGTLLANRYKVLDKIGEGAIASVYLCRDTEQNEVVAVKVMHRHVAAEGSFLRRFKKEAKILSVLAHRNLVKVFDFGEDGDVNFIVMEHVQGKTVAALIRERGSFELDQALDIFRQAAEALQHTWHKGIIHRDIKPTNLMVGLDGTVKIMDFGIAKSVETSAQTSTGLLGTPHYISPEQAEGREVDIRSDIYSLGVVLFEILSGKRLFEGESPVSIAIKHMEAPVPPITELRPDVPAAVADLLNKCLEKRPNRRFQNPAELLQAVAIITGSSARVETKPASLQADLLLKQARAALARKSWREAVEACERLLRSHPGHPEATQLLKRGQAELQKCHQPAKERLATLMEEAEGLLDKKEYSEAVIRLKEIMARNPRYPKVQELLARAEMALSEEDNGHKVPVLATDDGGLYPFPENLQVVTIGRKAPLSGIFPDIDLSDLDADRKVSRRHARIVFRNNRWNIVDEEAKHGTFLNRTRLTPGVLTPLKDGDRVLFAGVAMTFRASGSAAGPRKGR